MRRVRSRRSVCSRRRVAVEMKKYRKGLGELDVMDMETDSRREKMLALRAALLEAEEDRRRGDKGYSVEEVVAAMRSAMQDAVSRRRAE